MITLTTDEFQSIMYSNPDVLNDNKSCNGKHSIVDWFTKIFITYNGQIISTLYKGGI